MERNPENPAKDAHLQWRNAANRDHLSSSLNAEQMMQQSDEVVSDEATKENESDIYSYYSALDRLSDETSANSSSNSYDTAPDDEMSDSRSPILSPWEYVEGADGYQHGQQSSVDDGSEASICKTRMYGNNEAFIDTPSTEQEEDFDIVRSDYKERSPSSVNFGPSEDAVDTSFNTSGTEQDEIDATGGEYNEEYSSLTVFQHNEDMYEIDRSFNDTATEQESDVAENDFKEYAFQAIEADGQETSASPGIEFIMNRTRQRTISQSTGIKKPFSSSPGAFQRIRPNSWHYEIAKLPSNSMRSIKINEGQITDVNAIENFNSTEDNMSDEWDHKLKKDRLSLPVDTKHMKILQNSLRKSLNPNRCDTDIKENNQPSLEQQNNNAEDYDIGGMNCDVLANPSPKARLSSDSLQLESPTDKREDNLDEEEIKDVLEIKNCRLDHQSSSTLTDDRPPSSKEETEAEEAEVEEEEAEDKVEKEEENDGKVSPERIAIHPTVISPASNENNIDTSNELLLRNGGESEVNLFGSEDVNCTKIKSEFAVPSVRGRSETGLVEQMIKVFSCKKVKVPETECFAARTTIDHGVKIADAHGKADTVVQPQQLLPQPNQPNFMNTVKLESLKRRCDSNPHTEKDDSQQAYHHRKPDETDNICTLSQHVRWLNRVLEPSVVKQFNQSSYTAIDTPASSTYPPRLRSIPVSCCHYSRIIDNHVENSTPVATNVGSGDFRSLYNNSVELHGDNDAAVYVPADKPNHDSSVIRQDSKRHYFDNFVDSRNATGVRHSVLEKDKSANSRNKMETAEKCLKNLPSSRKNSTGIYVNGSNIVEISCSGNKLEPISKHCDRLYVKDIVGSRKNSAEIYVNGSAVVKHRLENNGSNLDNSRNNNVEGGIYSRHSVIAVKPYLESRNGRVSSGQDGEHRGNSFVVLRNNSVAGIHHAGSASAGSDTENKIENIIKRGKEHIGHNVVVLEKKNGSTGMYVNAVGDSPNSENMTNRISHQDVVERHRNTSGVFVTRGNSVAHYGSNAYNSENKAENTNRPILMETQNTISRSKQRYDSNTNYQTDVRWRPMETSVAFVKNLQNHNERASFELPPIKYQYGGENLETHIYANVQKPMELTTCQTIESISDAQQTNLAAKTHVQQLYYQNSQMAAVALNGNKAINRRHSSITNHQHVQFQNKYSVTTRRNTVMIRAQDPQQNHATKHTSIDVALSGNNPNSVSWKHPQRALDAVIFRLPIDTKHRAVPVQTFLPVPTSLRH